MYWVVISKGHSCYCDYMVIYPVFKTLLFLNLNTLIHGCMFVRFKVNFYVCINVKWKIMLFKIRRCRALRNSGICSVMYQSSQETPETRWEWLQRSATAFKILKHNCSHSPWESEVGDANLQYHEISVPCVEQNGL